MKQQRRSARSPMVFAGFSVVACLMILHLMAHSGDGPSNPAQLAAKPKTLSSSAQDLFDKVTNQQAAKKPRTAVAVYIHQGSYDRGFHANAEGMLDNIAVITSQVHRFAPVMKHDVQLIALLTNTSKTLAPLLTKLGWHVRIVELPMQPWEIRNPQIAKEVWSDGAIGIWEMLKLEFWRPSVVDLDVDSILIIDTDIHLRKPFDSVFEPPNMPANATLGYTHGAWTIEKVNGGYLVVRPDERSERDYHNIYDIFREGDFRSGTGWKGKVGWTYGGRTIQGLLPYYYLYGEGKGRGNYMSRCLYNNMVNSDECKPTKPEAVISNHFTGGCMKPWACARAAHPLCKALTDQWWEDVAVAEKWLGLPHRRRCPGGSYEAMGLRTTQWKLPG
ncbi:hypothetical protein DIPPA_35960 [Diplonema papillatum]|nr:hypothetical protein DIPPA_35960 [Diplonema papillatum]KAJ9469969.1 hypothetical protein DIPPA_35960 [Diplonema papillatum]|eukprot:gene3964-6142_t